MRPGRVCIHLSLLLVLLGCPTHDTGDDDISDDDDVADDDATGDDDTALDTTPPTVSFVSPVDEQTVSGSTEIQVEGSDDGGGVAMEVSLDGETFGSADTDTFEQSWDTTAAVNGAHQLAAACTDEAGNEASAEIVVFVNNGGLDGTVGLSAADAKFVGSEHDGAGWSVSAAGDVDADGYDDLVIGARGGPDAVGNLAGKAFVVHGPVSGVVPLSNADATLVGEEAGDSAGEVVSAAGDVDADGYDDLLVGALFHAAGGDYAGAAYLVLGPVSGTASLSSADAKFVGEEAEDFAGTSASAAGDVNRDGYDDLLIGADRNDEGADDAGAAYLVLGPVTGTVDLSSADAKFVGEEVTDMAGRSVAGAGDINADGYDDVLIGARRHGQTAGAAYLVYGPVAGTNDLSAADAKLLGEESEDLAGASVSAAGDVDGDGYDDLLVGASGSSAGGTYAGAAYLVLGPVTGTVDLSTAAAKLIGEHDNDYVGRSVSAAGDVNGDGFSDLLIDAYHHSSGAYATGAAYLAFGPVAGTVALSIADAKLVGEETEDGAGWSVSAAGDVNGDGCGDLLLGAPFHDAGGVDAGAAYLMLGGP